MKGGLKLVVSLQSPAILGCEEELIVSSEYLLEAKVSQEMGPVLTDEARRLIEALPPDGGSVTNHSLYEKLGWNMEHFFEVRGPLPEQNRVVKSPG